MGCNFLVACAAFLAAVVGCAAAPATGASGSGEAPADGAPAPGAALDIAARCAALSGPRFTCRFAAVSPAYLVVSGRSRDEADEMLARLDRLPAFFASLLPALGPPVDEPREAGVAPLPAGDRPRAEGTSEASRGHAAGAPSPAAVYLFPSHRGLASFAARLSGGAAPLAHGFYHRATGVAAVALDGHTKGPAWGAVAHEVFHQWLAARWPASSPPPPAWLDEGLAECMEAIRWDGPAPVAVEVHEANRREATALLAAGRLPALGDLLAAPRDQWPGRGGVLLAAAWSLAHFLISAPEGEPGRFLAAALGAPAWAEDRAEAAGVDLAAVERGWLEHVRALRDQKGTSP